MISKPHERSHIFLANLVAVTAHLAYTVARWLQLLVTGYTELIPSHFVICGVTIVVMTFSIRRIKNPAKLAFCIPGTMASTLIFAAFYVGGLSFIFLLLAGLSVLSGSYLNLKSYCKFVLAVNLTLFVSLVIVGFPIATGGEVTPAYYVYWVMLMFIMLGGFIAVRHATNRRSAANAAMVSFETMLAATPNFVALVDKQNRVTFLGGKLMEETQIKSMEYALWRPLLDLFDNPDMVKMITNVLNTDGNCENTAEVDYGGKKRYFKIISVVMGGEAQGRLIDFTDVTPLVRARNEAESASRAKSDFLARMSHEIRTPITAVLGVSEIQLQDPSLPPQLEDGFVKIHNSASTLLGIINDILDLSRIEAGKMQLIDKHYDTASLINDAANLYFTSFADKEVGFELMVDENLPAYLMGDSLRILQIINNLLSNAFKYTETGMVELSFICAPHSEEGFVTLEISVKDTGLGMTREQIKILHNDYTRFHEQEHRFIAGTGLGMPIVNSFVKIMGAQIDIQSEVMEGTTITVKVPQKTDGTETIGAETAEKLCRFDTTASGGAGKFKFEPEPMPYGKVLVVDDVEANIYVAKGLLAFFSLNIETASSGFEAIEKVRQGNTYNIIFMDYMMPGLNGAEALNKLREMGYAAPIVALTANAMVGQEAEFKKRGFDGFISKPIQIKVLSNILNTFIRDKTPQDIVDEARRNKEAVDCDIGGFMDSPEIAGNLRKQFVKNQKTAYEKITAALQSGDTETAHLLAHSLKSVSWLIKEPALAETAESIERTLADKKTPAAADLNALKTGLERVLANIGEQEAPPLPDKENIKALLDTLAEKLDARHSSCLDLLPQLKEIPETAVLARQIEEFDFSIALKTLQTLRAVLGV